MNANANIASHSSVISYPNTVLISYSVGNKKVCTAFHITESTNFCDDNKSLSYSPLDYMSLYAKDYQLLKADIDEFQSLESDWNGNHADPFDKQIISNAKSFLEYIKPYSVHVSVFPTARESIQFEYEHEDRYCEAEIFIDSVTVFATNRKNRKVRKNINSYNFIEKSANLFVSIFNGYWE